MYHRCTVKRLKRQEITNIAPPSGNTRKAKRSLNRPESKTSGTPWLEGEIPAQTRLRTKGGRAARVVTADLATEAAGHVPETGEIAAGADLGTGARRPPDLRPDRPARPLRRRPRPHLRRDRPDRDRGTKEVNYFKSIFFRETVTLFFALKKEDGGLRAAARRTSDLLRRTRQPLRPPPILKMPSRKTSRKTSRKRPRKKRKICWRWIQPLPPPLPRRRPTAVPKTATRGGLDRVRGGPGRDPTPARGRDPAGAAAVRALAAADRVRDPRGAVEPRRLPNRARSTSNVCRKT